MFEKNKQSESRKKKKKFQCSLEKKNSKSRWILPFDPFLSHIQYNQESLYIKKKNTSLLSNYV